MESGAKESSPLLPTVTVCTLPEERADENREHRTSWFEKYIFTGFLSKTMLMSEEAARFNGETAIYNTVKKEQLLIESSRHK